MNTSTQPYVSVIVPCFNAQGWVGDTIESLLAQTFSPMEVIVVDDGSTDGSWSVIRGFDDRVRAFHKPNGGLANARNFGVSHARGNYLYFLDADDVVAPDTIAALADAVQGAANAIGVCAWSRLVHESGGWTKAPPDVPLPAPDVDHLRAWLDEQWIPVCSLLWPRCLVERIGGYDETLTTNEDGDFTFRILLEGGRFCFASGGESFYRSHGTSALSMAGDNFSEHRYLSRMKVLAKLCANLQERNLWEKYREAVGAAYHRLALIGFQSQPQLARECLRLGEMHAGRRLALSRTLPGRALTKILGMERKERLVEAVARIGIISGTRRRISQRRELYVAGRHTDRQF